MAKCCPGSPCASQNIGFALQSLQRRLASSPAAVHESLRRRRERLEQRLAEERLLARGGPAPIRPEDRGGTLSAEELEDLADAPESEVEAAEARILDRATAARVRAELQTEIETLKRLEAQAKALRQSGVDAKWVQLDSILDHPLMTDEQGNRRKLIVFTEPRDSLNYLADKIRTRLGRPEAVVVIHGGVGREERRKAVEAFTQDKAVLVLVANDAAGEGINLQRAHLMINYDLPWNPNRLEQRFGRIHRIGQQEVCHLWNLVAADTREGEVYARLLEKLETAREALGGRVYDVLGRLFEGNALRDLLVEAIRYGDRPDVKERLFRVVDNAADRQHVLDLLAERALVHDTLSAGQIAEIREQMERAQARRLQPHFIQSFFLEAFTHLGGRIYPREPGRWEITQVPGPIRERDRIIGIGEPVLARYERVCFEKEKINQTPVAAFLCPGHPLAEDLKAQERAGKQTRLSSANAAARADELADRLQRRLNELDQERRISALPPVVRGGAIVVPGGLIRPLLVSAEPVETPADALAREEVERLAMQAVLAAERALGRAPRDVSAQQGLGYDIESKDPTTGTLVFIEVKGRWIGKNDITLTKNEILCSRNAPEQFRLALVIVAEEGARAPRYLRGFGFGEPDFAETTRTFSLPQLLDYAGEPV